MNKAFRIVLLIGFFAGTASACAPKVRVSTKDPIVINLNIKHEILIRVDSDVENLLDDSDLFGELLPEPGVAQGDDQ